MGWHRLASFCSFFSFYNLSKVRQGNPSATYVDKCTDNSANHVTQEAVGTYLEVPGRRAGLMPLGHRHVAQRGLHVACALQKAPKSSYSNNTLAASFISLKFNG